MREIDSADAGPRSLASMGEALRQALEGRRRGLLDRPLGLNHLRRSYRRALELPAERPFSNRALEVLGVSFRVDPDDLRRIPREGPVLLVANHPTGLVDGLILMELMRSVRADGRVLANAMLGAFTPLAYDLIGVDPYGGSDAASVNVRPVRECLRWLRDGGMVGVFPAGDVATLDVRRGGVHEGPWNPMIARIARSSRATVVPVNLGGRNDWAFHAMGLLHPRLRTAMMPRAMLAKEGQKIRVRVGAPVAPREIARMETDEVRCEHLRMKALLMGAGETRDSAREVAGDEPIARPSPAQLVTREIEALPRSQILHESEDFEVFQFRAPQAPTVLRELGRLREITFRDAEEGTGRALDLSEFDRDYVHLVVRDRAQNEIVGAYRLGATDEILPEKGPSGLYTTTLFRVPRRVLDRIDPALEMGRSFVRLQYQKSYQPLMLLWKGIGRYVAQRPRYRHLFGPVSINGQYRSVSTRLIMEFLRQNGHWSDLARSVRPRRPPHRPSWRERAELEAFGRSIRDVDHLGALITELEADGKGVPVLLRQYLKLGAELLGFNVDPDFADALDGLVLVDLTNTSPRILRKYMGPEGLARFLAFHADHSGAGIRVA